jgi:signal transduction histidine kinase
MLQKQAGRRAAREHIMHTHINISQESGGARLHRRGRWLTRLVPRPFYVVSSAFYLCLCAGTLYTLVIEQVQAQMCGCSPGVGRVLVVICAVGAFFALDRLEYRLYGEETPWRAAILLFLARVVVYEIAAAADYYQYSLVLTLFLPLLGYWYFGSLVGCGLTLLACVDYALHEAVNTPDYLSTPSNTVFNLLFVMALVFTLALVHVLVREKASRAHGERLLARLGEAHHQLEEAHGQLRLYAEQVEELATSRERTRLAREIHDSLGHYLTVISVQLEKALVFRERDQQEADQAVRDARQLASEALQDVRRSVSALRAVEETFAFIPAVTELVQRLQSDQLALVCQIKGSDESYSRQALFSLFRVVQEGLTNIQKYAEASAAQLDIDFGEAVATLCLTDNGRGFEPEDLAALPPGRQGSYGLQGIRERLELLGGNVQIRSKPGEGTYLSATVPRRQVATPGMARSQPGQGGKA